MPERKSGRRELLGWIRFGAFGCGVGWAIRSILLSGEDYEKGIRGVLGAEPVVSMYGYEVSHPNKEQVAKVLESGEFTAAGKALLLDEDVGGDISKGVRFGVRFKRHGIAFLRIGMPWLEIMSPSGATFYRELNGGRDPNLDSKFLLITNRRLKLPEFYQLLDFRGNTINFNIYSSPYVPTLPRPEPTPQGISPVQLR